MLEIYRQKLDSIVSQMQTEGQSDDEIKFVVNDFKGKYDVPTPPELPGAAPEPYKLPFVSELPERYKIPVTTEEEITAPKQSFDVFVENSRSIWGS
jgi:hypothetical protein